MCKMTQPMLITSVGSHQSATSVAVECNAMRSNVLLCRDVSFVHNLGPGDL